MFCAEAKDAEFDDESSDEEEEDDDDDDDEDDDEDDDKHVVDSHSESDEVKQQHLEDKPYVRK